MSNKQNVHAQTKLVKHNSHHQAAVYKPKEYWSKTLLTATKNL